MKIKVKVSEASGPVLDWMVERALGTHWSDNGYFVFRYIGCGPNGFISSKPQWNYSTDWAQGGPIIEREGIWVSDPTGDVLHLRQWGALWHGNLHDTRGPTPLIAAMRCFVASKLGDEVDVPEELL